MNEQSIFTAALQRDASERRVFLDGACQGKPELRERLEELLAAHENAAEFMSAPEGDLAATLAPTISEAPGTEIGRYKLREQIGEGGFGVVYVAEQSEPVQRKVALKIVKPGMDSKEVVARFEAERQALALMDHPNVARVIDGGTTDSARPYFVMELVHGLPITEFCDKNKLPTRDRLELFLQVCHAVQHAHQKGIIHRDLKPSNIMVTLHDGKPVPKVIDFGVAKALSQKLTEKTIYTSYGQVVGTPQYMSPEQAEMSGLGIDTRSDIYSLGVLLYELLTGQPPVDKKRLLASGYAEMMRIIREEEPPRPSKRISTLGQEATAIAEHRRTDQKNLTRSLRGELDWIVMKALDKERERRYDTASNFAADIGRFLKNEAVQAYPPSTIYRLRKYVQRHPARIAVLAATAAALMLAAGMLVSLGYQNRLVSTNAELEGAKTRLESSLDHERELGAQLAESKSELDRALYFRHISQALAAWYDGEVGRAKRLLDNCPTAWRHWEWHYAANLFKQGVTTLERHSGWVGRLALSSDGKLVASGSNRDGTVRVWDLNRGELTRTFHGLDKVRGLTFSRDGRWLLSGPNTVAEFGTAAVNVWDIETGQQVRTIKNDGGWCVSPSGMQVVTCEDKTLKLWDIEDHRLCQSFPGHANVVTSVAFSPDGKRIASGSRDRTVKVWDAATGNEALRLEGHKGAIGFVRFSPDGERILSTVAFTERDRDRTARVWDAKTGEQISTIENATPRSSRRAAFSPDGTKIVITSRERTAKMCHTESGEVILTLRGHASIVGSVSFSGDGKRILTASHDHRVKIWDAETGQVLSTLKGHTDVVGRAYFTPDGKQVVSASRDGTMKIWDLETEQDTRTLRGHTAAVWSVGFSPDRSRIVSGSDDMSVILWDNATGQQVHLKGHTAAVRKVVFSNDGRRIASSDNDNKIIVWDAETAEQLRTLDAHSGPWGIGLAFSPDGKRIVSGGDDSKVTVWDADSGEEILTFNGHDDPVWSVAFSPNGKLVATGQRFVKFQPVVKLWDANSGSEILELEGHTHGIADVAFSPDGTLIITGSWDNTVRIWDARTGTEVKTLRTDSWVHGIAISPDGKRIVAGLEDGTVRMWDLDSGSEALTLKGHTDVVTSVDFSPDGSQIVSGSEDGTIKIWDAATSEFIVTAN